MSDYRPRKRFRITFKRPALPGDGGGAHDARVEVVVRSMGGEEVAKVQLNPTCPIAEVKRSIQEIRGYPPEAQRLLLRDATLQDDTLLNSLHTPLSFTLVVLDFDRVDALQDAIEGDHEAAVRWLLERSFRDDEARREMLLHPMLLFRAIYLGHEGVCRALLGAAPIPEAGDDYGLTALMVAAREGHAAICRLLLGAAPGMVNATNIHEETALQWAAEYGHAASCQVLLESAAGAGVCRELLLRPCRPEGNTALHVAAMCGHEMACRALLEAAPSPEARGEVLGARNDSSRTALDLAVDRGREMVAQLLRDAAR